MTASAAPQGITPQRFDLEGAGGRPIRGEVRLVPNARASVVLVHGFKGFARFAFFPFLADRLASAGITAVTFNFSGSGVGEDMETFTDPAAFEENTYTRELHDLGIVLAEGERLGWITQQHGLFGHSRGGGIAILRAARDVRIHALATWATISTVKRWPTDVAEEWRTTGEYPVENARTKQVFKLRTAVLEEATEYGDGMLDVTRAAETLLCPWLIVHGDADETVQIGESEQLARAAGSNATLLRIAGGTHTFNVAHGMTSPSPQLLEATDRTVRFFVDRLLGASALTMLPTAELDRLQRHPRIVRLLRSLAEHPPLEVEAEATVRRAAILIALRARADGEPELLMIKRAEAEGDPWSGHIACPGGRMEPGDRDLAVTAVRETWEETGVDVARDGRLLGHLDDLYPRTPALPPIVIRPYVALVRAEVEIVPSHEVAAAFWVPLAALAERGAWGAGVVTVRGVERRVTVFQHGEYTVWGLTERALRQLLTYMGVSPDDETS